MELMSVLVTLQIAIAILAGVMFRQVQIALDEVHTRLDEYTDNLEELTNIMVILRVDITELQRKIGP